MTIFKREKALHARECVLILFYCMFAFVTFSVLWICRDVRVCMRRLFEIPRLESSMSSHIIHRTTTVTFA